MIYTDGSFELVRVQLLAALKLSRTDQTAQYGRGATGIYIQPTGGHPALALQLTTPTGRATDAYYQELLGTAMGALMVQHNTICAYSDCQAAIRRFRHASNSLGVIYWSVPEWFPSQWHKTDDAAQYDGT